MNENYYLIETTENGFPVKDYKYSLIVGKEDIYYELTQYSISFIRLDTGRSNNIQKKWKERGCQIPLVGTISYITVNTRVRDLLSTGESFKILAIDPLSKKKKFFLLIYGNNLSMWNFDY
jgi:hypothetical protein